MSNNSNSEKTTEEVVAKIMEEMKKKEEMAYEKAIDGYQFLVNRYHTWMNYYSIFTGAFFIALYTVWDKGETETVIKCACCKCCKMAASSPDMFLLYLIIGLGWFSSICWLASLIGHRTWMGSWLRIVRKWEKSVLDSNDFVYRKIILGRNNLTTSYISTQKVTTGFVCAVILAWELIFCYLLFIRELKWEFGVCCVICSIVILFGVVLIIKQILSKCCCSLISDDLTDMIQ